MIGGLIGAHVSSRVNEAIKTISSQSIFFTKMFWAHKNANQTKTNQENKNERTKKNFFFGGGEGWCFLCTQNLFVKTNRVVWNCLDSLSYSTTANSNELEPWINYCICIFFWNQIIFIIHLLIWSNFIFLIAFYFIWSKLRINVNSNSIILINVNDTAAGELKAF